MQIGVAVETDSARKLEWKLRYDENRPWERKWQDVLAGLNDIEHFYAQKDATNAQPRRIVEEFFMRCRELADWLDKAANIAATGAFVHGHDALRICDGIAQTTKHHTRALHTRSDPITAWI